MPLRLSAGRRAARVEDVEQMVALGRDLGRAARVVSATPLVVALSGPLGAGKTALARGVGQGLGLSAEILSPTFIVMAEHPGDPPLLHADLYRVEAADLQNLGLEELIEGWPGLVLVEWAELHPQVLPADRVEVRIGHDGDHRRVEAVALGPAAQALLDAWWAAR